MARTSKVTTSNKNKMSSEVIIAANLILSKSDEAKGILDGIKDTIVRSNFRPTENFNNFMGIYSKLIERKRALLDDFTSKRSELIIKEIQEIFCTVTPSEKKQKTFLNWLKDVEDKIVYVDMDFIKDDGDLNIDEIVYYYYWNCFKDYVEGVDLSNDSYYEKLKITPPVIVDATEDKDIVSLGSVTETLNTESKYTLGIESVDEYIKLQPTNLCYVGARPSVGKSMFVMNAAMKNGLNGIPSLYVSLEMTPVQTKTRCDSWIEGESIYREVDIDEINKNVFMLDAKEMNGDYIFSKIEKFAVKNPGCIIILDYIGLVRYEGLDEWGSLRKASLTAKGIALKTKCVFLSCAMADRASELSGFTMSSLFGSSTLEADSDIIIGLEPIKGSGREVEKLAVKIAKNRNGVKDVDCWVDMNKRTMHFEDSN